MSTLNPIAIRFTQPDYLRKARELAGYTQQELADLIGIDRASVVKYEKVGVEKEYILRPWAEFTNVALDDIRPEANPSDYQGTVSAPSVSKLRNVSASKTRPPKSPTARARYTTHPRNRK